MKIPPHPDGPAAELHDRADAEYDRAERESAATLAVPPEVVAPDPREAGKYTPGACQRFAEGLDGSTLQRAIVLLEHLFTLGSLDEDALAKAIGIEPVELWGTVTNPLKLHAKTLGLPLPYQVVTVARDPYWEDSLGIAGLLVSVMRDEIDRRHMAGPVEAEHADVPTKAAIRDRYAPLHERLAGIPLESPVAMDLEEIETLIGFELPPKAWGDEGGWTRNADVPYRHHSRSWRDTGREAHADLKSFRIVFAREISEPEFEPEEGGLRRISRTLFGRKKKACGGAPAEASVRAGPSTEVTTTAPAESTAVAATHVDEHIIAAQVVDGAGLVAKGEVATAQSIATPAETHDPSASEAFSTDLCAEFASGMTDRALGVAHVLFSEFASNGRVDSSLLAELLELKPSSLAGTVAGPLRRRAKALDCETPYLSVKGGTGRATVWQPAEGAMPNMADAIALERARRSA